MFGFVQKTEEEKLTEALQQETARGYDLVHQKRELLEHNQEITQELAALKSCWKDLTQQLEDARRQSTTSEAKLRSKLSAMKDGWNSLYEYEEEHKAAERKRSIKARDSQATQAADEQDKRGSQQADLLQSAVKLLKRSSLNKSPLELKLEQLEEENKQLKSQCVRYQTKYREAKYRNEHPPVIKEESVSTADISDSSSLDSDEKVAAAGSAVGFGFSKLLFGASPNPSPAPSPASVKAIKQPAAVVSM